MKINCPGIICALLLNFCNAFSQIPTDSLVAYYPFNINANDSSGNGFNGTLNGQIPVTGHCAGAYKFSGNYISCGDPSGNQFDLINNASISLWVKLYTFPASSGGNRDYFTLVGKDIGGGNNDKWFLAIYRDQLVFHINAQRLGGGFWAASTLIAFPLNSFYHIVVTKNANTYRFYVNGYSYGSQTLPANIVDVSSPLRIGDLQDGSAVLDAAIDEVLIYRRALIQSEINQLYTSCPGVVTAVGAFAQDQAGDITIFPNPTSGSFTLKTSAGFADKKIRIINMEGQMIKQLYTRQDNLNITVDKEGVFLIQIISGGKIFTKRLMIVAH